MNRIFIILSVLVLAGCSESLELQLDPEVNVFVSNDSEQRIQLTAKDIEYTALNDWLQENSSGWYSTSGRYPGGVYLKSGGYGIQVTKTHVILYSTTGPAPKAIYIQKIEPGELKAFQNIQETPVN